MSRLAANTTYTITRTAANTATISDGTNTTQVTTAGTIGASGTANIVFSGALNATITVAGNSAKTMDDVLKDLNGKTIITAAGTGSASYQVGANASDQISVAFNNMQSTAIGTGGSQIGVLITDNTSVASENLSASESGMLDADLAKTSSDLVAAQIMQQAGVSVLAQANASAQVALTLIQKM